MNIKILGTGCPKCLTLEKKVLEIREKYSLDFSVEKITQIEDIMAYGVMMTPGLVIDETLKSAGRIPKEQEILDWLGVS